MQIAMAFISFFGLAILVVWAAARRRLWSDLAVVFGGALVYVAAVRGMVAGIVGTVPEAWGIVTLIVGVAGLAAFRAVLPRLGPGPAAAPRRAGGASAQARQRGFVPASETPRRRHGRPERRQPGRPAPGGKYAGFRKEAL